MDWLEERLKSTKNRVEIALVLYKLERYDLIYTELEDLHYGTQTIIDEHCKENEKDTGCSCANLNPTDRK